MMDFIFNICKRCVLVELKLPPESRAEEGDICNIPIDVYL